MGEDKSIEALALAVEQEQAFKITEAQVVSSQHELCSAKEKLRQSELRVEELKQVIREKDSQIDNLGEEVRAAKAEVADKEQARGALEGKVASLKEEHERDKNSSGAALMAMQKDKDASVELINENHELRTQVANLSAEVFAGKNLIRTLEGSRDVLQQKVEDVTSSLTSKKNEWLEEKHNVVSEIDATQMSLRDAQATAKALREGESEWRRKCAALLSEKRQLIGSSLEQKEQWLTADRELKSELERMSRARDMFKDAAQQSHEANEFLKKTCKKLSKQMVEQKAAHDQVVRDAELLHSELDAEVARYKSIVESIDAGYIPAPIPKSALPGPSTPEIESTEEMSKVELYAKYTETRCAQREESMRCQEDLKRKTEYIHHLTDEQTKMTTYINGLRSKFDFQSQECDSLKDQIEALERLSEADKAAVEQLQEEIDVQKRSTIAAETCAEELSRQVEYLTKENIRIKDKDRMFHLEYTATSVGDGPSTSDQPGSSDLVIFEDVEGLTRQNKNLRKAFQTLIQDCRDKEEKWKKGMDKEKERLWEMYGDELREVQAELRKAKKREKELQKEKNIYFDMMMKDSSGGAKALPEYAIESQNQGNTLVLQAQVHTLERKLKEGEDTANHVSILEERLKNLRDDLAQAQEKSAMHQATQEASLDHAKKVESKFKTLKSDLQTVKTKFAAEQEATRFAKAASRQWERKAEELQGSVTDLKSQIHAILAEQKNAIEARDDALVELEKLTTERTSLAVKLELAEAQHKSDMSKIETGEISTHEKVQSSIDAALAKIGEDVRSVAHHASDRKALEEEKARLESIVKDLEDKTAGLMSEISALKAAISASDAQVAELRNVIKLQEETPGISTESAKKLFTLRQQLAAAQEECSRQKTTSEQMQVLAREKDSKLQEMEGLVKEKEEELETNRAELLAYKKKLTTLAKTMKAPLDERKQLDQEIAALKAQVSRANEEKEKVEQKLVTVVNELESTKKQLGDLETSISLGQIDKKEAEEAIGEQQSRAAAIQLELDKTKAELLDLEQQLQEAKAENGVITKAYEDKISALTEAQNLLENKYSNKEFEYTITSQKLAEKEAEVNQLTQAQQSPSQLPFDIQQELQRLRMLESSHQSDVSGLKRENEVLKADNRSLVDKNESLGSQMTGLQGDIQGFRNRFEKLNNDNKAQTNALSNNLARQGRAIALKDEIIDNLKQQLAQSEPKEEQTIQKPAQEEATRVQGSLPFQVEPSAEQRGFGQLLGLKQRVMKKMSVVGSNNPSQDIQQPNTQLGEDEVQAPFQFMSAPVTTPSVDTNPSTAQDTMLIPTGGSLFDIPPAKREREEFGAPVEAGNVATTEHQLKKKRGEEPETTDVTTSPQVVEVVSLDNEDDLDDIVDYGSDYEMEDFGGKSVEGDDLISNDPEEDEEDESPETSGGDPKMDQTQAGSVPRPAPGTAFANRRRSGRLLAEEGVVSKEEDDDSKPRHTPIVFMPGRLKRSTGRGRGRGRGTRDGPESNNPSD